MCVPLPALPNLVLPSGCNCYRDLVTVIGWWPIVWLLFVFFFLFKIVVKYTQHGVLPLQPFLNAPSSWFLHCAVQSGATVHLQDTSSSMEDTLSP